MNPINMKQPTNHNNVDSNIFEDNHVDVIVNDLFKGYLNGNSKLKNDILKEFYLAFDAMLNRISNIETDKLLNDVGGYYDEETREEIKTRIVNMFTQDLFGDNYF